MLGNSVVEGLHDTVKLAGSPIPVARSGLESSFLQHLGKLVGHPIDVLPFGLQEILRTVHPGVLQLRDGVEAAALQQAQVIPVGFHFVALPVVSGVRAEVGETHEIPARGCCRRVRRGLHDGAEARELLQGEVEGAASGLHAAPGHKGHRTLGVKVGVVGHEIRRGVQVAIGVAARELQILRDGDVALEVAGAGPGSDIPGDVRLFRGHEGCTSVADRLLRERERPLALRDLVPHLLDVCHPGLAIPIRLLVRCQPGARHGLYVKDPLNNKTWRTLVAVELWPIDLCRVSTRCSLEQGQIVLGLSTGTIGVRLSSCCTSGGTESKQAKRPHQAGGSWAWQ
mmetsp:Transcript_115905/g.322729  ORF Transcript_115905/g.322729 Transcript_115905/m.322729 type:complete len:340 (+) Transcript_115905:646-1665(+)